MKIFRRIALENYPTIHLGGRPMIVSESYPAIHLGGLSNRFYRNSVLCFQEQKPFVGKQCFLTLGLGMREGVSEGSKSGKG